MNQPIDFLQLLESQSREVQEALARMFLLELEDSFFAVGDEELGQFLVLLKEALADHDSCAYRLLEFLVGTDPLDVRLQELLQEKLTEDTQVPLDVSPWELIPPTVEDGE